jgi:hypothetical protein
MSIYFLKNGGSGRSGQQSPTGGKSKKVPTFNTFHYEDPAHPSDVPILPPVAEEVHNKTRKMRVK